MPKPLINSQPMMNSKISLKGLARSGYKISFTSNDYAHLHEVGTNRKISRASSTLAPNVLMPIECIPSYPHPASNYVYLAVEELKASILRSLDDFAACVMEKTCTHNVSNPGLAQ